MGFDLGSSQLMIQIIYFLQLLLSFLVHAVEGITVKEVKKVCTVIPTCKHSCC